MATSTIRVGATLGRYQLLEQIGSGGMGVVFRAHDQRLARDVAIKLLHPGSTLSVVARHRVRNEAMALSRISHPNIETIFEFDSQDDCDFLVVELIPGKSVDELIARGPLPTTLAVSLTMQLLRGLAAAHEKGIIHRDLKPSNLRLTPDSFLKILDFGIAHVEDENAEAHDLTTETHANILSGTLTYMSPEQLRGAHLNPRSDLYAVGLILYQMCAGRLPFTETGAMLIDAILNKPVPPPSKFNNDISPALEGVILKALEKDPRKRYQSAREMLGDLEALDSALRAPHGRRLQIASLVISALILALVGILEGTRVGGWVQRQLNPVPANKYVAVLPFRSLTNDDPAFNEGLTETVAGKLMEITAAQPVQIVSPRELQAEHIADADQARIKLGVNLVIEGTLQEHNDNTRVNLELVDTSTRRSLRAANFVTRSSDVFALQDDVIRSATQMLEVEIHRVASAQGTTNPEAFRFYTRGRGYLQNQVNPEDLDSAIDQFQHALSIDPGYAAAHAALGLAHLQEYRVQKDPALVNATREECDKALALDAGLPDGGLCLGDLYIFTGQYELAASALKLVVERDIKSARAYQELGVAYESLGRPELAEQTYKQAISAFPQYGSGYDRLGQFYSRQARYSDAIEEFRKAIKLVPQNSEYWASLGGVYYYAGQYESALDALQRSITIRPSYAAYENLGSSYFALQRFSDAIAAFEQALTMGDKQIQAHGNLARAYYWDREKHELARPQYLKALELVQEALRVNPRDADTHILAAQYCSMIGRKEEAIGHLQAALRTRPNDAETLYFAAIVYSQLGEKEEALSWLHKALKAGYSSAEVAITPELSWLRNDSAYNRQAPQSE